MALNPHREMHEAWFDAVLAYNKQCRDREQPEQQFKYLICHDRNGSPSASHATDRDQAKQMARDLNATAVYDIDRSKDVQLDIEGVWSL